MATVAVTGASGFIGVPLVEHLRGVGHPAVAIAGTVSANEFGLDLRDGDDAWAEVLTGCEVVVNLAGRAHDVRRHTTDQADEYRSVNSAGAERVARAAKAAGARRFIQISTVKVLGESPQNGTRFCEGDRLHPVGTYAESKADGECLVAEALAGSDTECVILRLPLVFGTPFKGNLASLEQAIRRGIPLPFGHHSIGRRSYVMLPDLVEMLGILIESPGPLPPVLHTRSADLTAAELAWLIGHEIGHRPRIVSVPASVLRAGAAALRRPELASKLCDEMLISDDLTRAAFGRASA